MHPYESPRKIESDMSDGLNMTQCLNELCRRPIGTGPKTSTERIATFFGMWEWTWTASHNLSRPAFWAFAKASGACSLYTFHHHSHFLQPNSDGLQPKGAMAVQRPSPLPGLVGFSKLLTGRIVSHGSHRSIPSASPTKRLRDFP